MTICTRCGESNPDGVSRCNKCGIALGAQIRAAQDVKRAQTGKVVRGAAWITFVVVLVLAAPSIYHAAGTAYYKQHLKGITQVVMTHCGGPVTNDMQAYQKDQVSKCIDKDEDLIAAQHDYDNFTGGGKH
jgi:zinc-ribbon domain